MMTRQEVFNKVVTHIFAQGAPATGENHDCLRRNVCRYRTSSGLSCAIGCLIEDEYYNEGLENQSATSKDVVNALRKSGVEGTELDFRFLDSIQINLHDNFIMKIPECPPDNTKYMTWFIEQAVKLSNTYNLTLPEIINVRT